MAVEELDNGIYNKKAIGKPKAQKIVNDVSLVRRTLERKFRSDLLNHFPSDERLLETVADWALKWATLRVRYAAAAMYKFPSEHLLGLEVHRGDYYDNAKKEESLVNR